MYKLLGWLSVTQFASRAVTRGRLARREIGATGRTLFFFNFRVDRDKLVRVFFINGQRTFAMVEDNFAVGILSTALRIVAGR